nr:TlpA disulfide reductase family protein [Corynebacterium choanae]
MLLAGCSSQPAADEGVIAAETFQFASPGGQLEIRYSPAERKPIAPFSGESLMDPGHTIASEDFAGGVTVLSAWGQWCGPCRTEIDDLQEIHETLQRHGGSVLGINVRDNSRAIAQDFITDNGATYPSIYDPPFKTAAALGGVPASVIPTTIVLDKQQRVAAVFLRAITADEVLAVTNELESETA